MQTYVLKPETPKQYCFSIVLYKHSKWHNFIAAICLCNALHVFLVTLTEKLDF